MKINTPLFLRDISKGDEQVFKGRTGRLLFDREANPLAQMSTEFLMHQDTFPSHMDKSTERSPVPRLYSLNSLSNAQQTLQSPSKKIFLQNVSSPSPFRMIGD